MYVQNINLQESGQPSWPTPRQRWLHVPSRRSIILDRPWSGGSKKHQAAVYFHPLLAQRVSALPLLVIIAPVINAYAAALKLSSSCKYWCWNRDPEQALCNFMVTRGVNQQVLCRSSSLAE